MQNVPSMEMCTAKDSVEYYELHKSHGVISQAEKKIPPVTLPFPPHGKDLDREKKRPSFTLMV